MPPDCIAAREYANDLKPLLGGVARIQMPRMNSDYWGPYENAGLRYLRALALDPEEGSKLLNKEIGDVKMARRAVTVFFKAMHGALSQVIKLPKGGK
jgi:hypothetical protein